MIPIQGIYLLFPDTLLESLTTITLKSEEILRSNILGGMYH